MESTRIPKNYGYGLVQKKELDWTLFENKVFVVRLSGWFGEW